MWRSCDSGRQYSVLALLLFTQTMFKSISFVLLVVGTGVICFEYTNMKHRTAVPKTFLSFQQFIKVKSISDTYAILKCII